MKLLVARTADVIIRSARDSEGPVCHMLLPETGGGPREFLVAVQDAPPYVMGAACFRQGAQALFGVRVRVVRTHRRCGIGSRLVESVIEAARQRAARAVIAQADPDSEPEAEPFLERHGFTRRARVRTVEADIQAMRAHLGELRQRLQAAGKVPSGARIVPYSEASPEEVARLYAEYILGHPELDPERIQHAMANMKVESSPVLLVDGRVEGMLLESLEGSLATVHARVVARRHRAGWANALLMGAAIEQGWAAGARRVRFDIPGGNRDTEKLARRLQAERIRTLDRWVLSLGGGSGG